MIHESILIKNTQVIKPSGIYQADVYIQKGKISAFGESLSLQAEHNIDGKDLHLLPGIIDPHVHFRSPGLEWKEDFVTGSKAAAAGGVTTIFDMPNTDPPTTTEEVIINKKKTAAEQFLVNYNFYIGATPDNIDILSSIPNLCGIKVYMGSTTGNLLVDEEEFVEAIFAQGKRLIAVHAESEKMIQENQKKYARSKEVLSHPKIRDPQVALEATRLAVRLSKKYQRRLHIAHMSTEEELKLLRAEGTRFITSEVCPQHFLLHSPAIYQKLDTFAQMNPPLREARHGKALWEGLMKNEIQCLASDHAPHTIEEKQQEFGKAPSGLPGVETTLPLMLNLVNTGKCSLPQLTQWMSKGPADTFGIPNKGLIEPGYDADLVLVDMKKKYSIENGSLHTKVNWSPFHGWETQGWPIMTFVNGNLVFREGDFFTEMKGKEVSILANWE